MKVKMVIHHEIEVEIEKAKSRIKTLQEWNETALQIEKYSQEYIDLYKCTPGKISIGVGIEYGFLHGVLLKVYEVENIKLEIVPVLKHLTRLGYRMSRHKQIGDDSDINRRNWNLINKKGTPLIVCAFFKEKSNVCRYIQTGVKTEPVFELRCD